MGDGERLAHRDRDPGPERLMVTLKMNHQLHRGRKEIEESWGSWGRLRREVTCDTQCHAY